MKTIAQILTTCLYFLIATATPTTAHAMPITISVVHTVTKITPFDLVDPAKLVSAPEIGSQYQSLIVIDSEALMSDGATLAYVVDVDTVIGPIRWTTLQGSSLVGFRGMCPVTTPDCSTTGSRYFGFEFRNNEVANIFGGLYGSMDVPYVDFLGSTFKAQSMFYDVDNYYHTLTTEGTLSFNLVPEPTSIALLLIGALALMYRCVRK